MTAKYKYSDSAEEFLFNFFNKPQSKKNQEIAKVLQSNPSWPILYHLTPQREALLNWYPFNPKGSLLEIGAGCGSLTGLFTGKVKKVFANELTESRSSIIKKRYSDKTNLEVITGNLMDLKLNQTVDYISVIGVLEYAGRFFTQDFEDNFYEPYLFFLKHVKQYLNKKGKVLLAIENKLGLKYIVGGREDHYGDLFSSLEDYPNYDGIRTFSKTELTKLFKQAGFETVNFYYPFPDYKLPHIVFSDHFLKNGLNLPKSYYAKVVDKSNERVFLFNEVIFAENLFKERILDKFANSFLVEASL